MMPHTISSLFCRPHCCPGQPLAKAASTAKRLAATALVPVLAAMLLAACTPSPFNRPAPDRKLYNISVQRTGQTLAAKDKSVLKLRQLQISPAYQNKEMVYRLGEVEYETDYYNAFFMQPAQSLTQQTELWLARSGLFGHVVDATSQVQDTHLLEGMVNALYGDFRDRSSPKAVVEIQFFLLKNKDERYSVIFSKNYAKAIPFSSNFKDATGLTEAYNQALNGILQELEADLRNMK